MSSTSPRGGRRGRDDESETRHLFESRADYAFGLYPPYALPRHLTIAHFNWAMIVS